MLRNKSILKEQLNRFSKAELVEILTKISTKRFNYEFLLVKYLDPEGGEQLLFEDAKVDIEFLMQKEFKGRTLPHQMVKRLKACTNRIKNFTEETKDKKLEADLILYVLEIQFRDNSQVFGAKYSGYDYKVGLLLKRLIGLVTNKLHVDYFVDYQDKINKMLTLIHQSSNRINTIKSLPNSIE